MSKGGYYKHKATLKDKHRYRKLLSEEEDLILLTGYGTTYLRQRFIIQLILPGAVFILLGLGIGYWYQFENMGQGLMLGLVLASLWSAFQTYIVNISHRYLLTTRRVILKQGFFSVKIASALYDKITHIEVEQSFYDRVFLHHGDVVIDTAGANRDEVVLKYVEEPIEFKNILERLIHKERQQYSRSATPLDVVEGEIVDE